MCDDGYHFFSVYNYCDVAKGFLNWAKIGYTIDNKGEGAYSTVFRVERVADKKVYALKKVKLANLSEK